MAVRHGRNKQYIVLGEKRSEAMPSCPRARKMRVDSQKTVIHLICILIINYEYVINNEKMNRYIPFSSLIFLCTCLNVKRNSGVPKIGSLGKFWNFVIEILSGYLEPLFSVNLGAINFGMLSNWSMMSV